MKNFECDKFIILGFNPNDLERCQGRVEFKGYKSDGCKLYQFIHDPDSPEFIRAYPYSFIPMENARIIDEGFWGDTLAFIVAITPPALFECGGQLFRCE
jgi:hypothetical protein